MKFSVRASSIAIALAVIIGLILGVMPVRFHRSSLTVTVDGNFGAMVFVNVTGKISQKPSSRVLIDGDGERVSDGDQALVRISNFAYTSGGYLSVINDGSVKASSVSQDSLGDLYELVAGKREGTRVLGIFPDSSRAYVEIIVLDILPTRVRAQMHTNPEQMPRGVSVSLDSSGVPRVDGSVNALGSDADSDMVPGDDGGDGSADKADSADRVVNRAHISEQQVAILVAGDGEQISPSDSVYVNYIICQPDGTVLESTYENAQPAYVDLTQVFSGLAQALVDQRVGSRVFAAIPAVNGRGDGDLLIVVDILAKAEENNT